MLFLTNCTATTAIYTLSLHDALPIFFFKKRSNDDGALPLGKRFQAGGQPVALEDARLVLLERLLGDAVGLEQRPDRKSTRLNSSHLGISYAVFCLKKKTSTLSAHEPP